MLHSFITSMDQRAGVLRRIESLVRHLNVDIDFPGAALHETVRRPQKDPLLETAEDE